KPSPLRLILIKRCFYIDPVGAHITLKLFLRIGIVKKHSIRLHDSRHCLLRREQFPVPILSIAHAKTSALQIYRYATLKVQFQTDGQDTAERQIRLKEFLRLLVSEQWRDAQGEATGISRSRFGRQ